MGDNRVQCVIGVVCLLLAGCASTPAVDTPPSSTIASPARTEPHEPAQPAAIVPTLAPTLTPPPPAFQFQCGSDIQEIAYSPDGALLAALGKQRITICDMSTLSPRVTLETESEITGGIDWSPKGTRLVAGLATGQVRIWDTATWQEVITYQVSDAKAEGWDVAWSPDGYRLLTTGVEVGTHIWHASTGEELLSTEDNYPIVGGAWSPDSKQIAISKGGATIKDSATGQDLFHIGTYYSGLRSAAWSPDGSRFVVQWELGILTMSDAKTAETLLSWEAHDVAGSSAFLDSPVWSVDGKWLAAVSSYDGTSSIIYIWDTSTGQELATIGPVGEAASLDWSPDGKYLAGSTKDGIVSLWEPYKLVRPPAPLSETSLSAEGPWYTFMASMMWDGYPYLWAINADGTGLTKLSHEPTLGNFAVRSATADDNGTMIAFAVKSPRVSEDDILKIVTLPGEEVRANIPLGATRAGSNEYHWHYLRTAITAGGLVWSPDGSKLAFASARNGDSSDISLYDAKTGTVTGITTGKDYAYPLRWSPDGRYLIYERFTHVTMGRPDGMEIWSAHTDGTGEVFLRREPYTSLLGWRGPIEGVFEHPGIEVVNIATGESQTIVNEKYYSAAFAEKYHTLLMTLSNEPGPETPLILIRNDERIELPGRQIEWVQWDSTLDLFVGWVSWTENEKYYISPLGQYVDRPQPEDFQPIEWADEMPDVYKSPDKTLWLWRHRVDVNEDQLWIGESETEPGMKILSFKPSHHVADITWSPDSQFLFFLRDDGLWVSRRPGFEFVQIGRGMLHANCDRINCTSAWVP